MAGHFQVVAECAHVTLTGPTGRATNLLLKGAMVPADAPELPRLLDLGFVAQVGADETGGVDASGVPAGAYGIEVPANITSTPVAKSPEQLAAEQEAAAKAQADADLTEKRAAARAKLPADGSAPDGRASQEVWVEFLVSKGSDYDSIKDVEKAELRALADQQKS